MFPAIVLTLLTSVDGGVPALPLTASERAAEAKITSAEIARHTRYLASDALEGRAPGSRGDRLTQQYLVRQFKALGLKGGAPDGGYLQEVELVGVTGNPESVTLFLPDGGTQALKYREEFIAVAGEPRAESKLEGAELVFVGYGIEAPEFGWDDYKGQDLKGKVLLMMNSDPESDPALFAGRARLWYGRWDYKYEVAARKGAAGVVLIHTTPSAGYPWSVVQTSWSGEQFELPGGTQPQCEVELWFNEETSRRVVALAGLDLDSLWARAQSREFRPIPLGIKLSTAFTNRVIRKKTANLIGKLPGSDPELAREGVVYTAHHDHLGKKAGAKPGEDAIYNGAVDNASGVAQMLTVARAFRALKPAPRRSIYFAAVAAEEQGLLGSQFLAQNSPLPPGRWAANINIDGANIWGKTRDVTVIGHGKSSLDGLIETIAASQGRRVTPDQLPDRGFFYRSDQFNFAKLGVPAAYAESGMDVIGRPTGWGKAQKETFEAAHYHQPSDAYSPRWDLSGAVQDSQLYFHLGRLVANTPALPTWNPGDEFEHPRQEALRRLPH